MLKNSVFKDARCAYLYADGHAVIVHEKRDAKVGVKLEWVTFHSPAEVGIRCSFKGRCVVLHQALMPVLFGSKELRVSTDDGSDKTRERGIKVVTFSISNDNGTWFLSTFPGLVSSDMEYSPEYEQAYADTAAMFHWAGYPVARTETMPSKRNRAGASV